MANKKISDMNEQELEYFDFICTKLEVKTDSTESLRKVIQSAKKYLDEQAEEVKKEIIQKKKYLGEMEKMIGNLEKGVLR